MKQTLIAAAAAFAAAGAAHAQMPSWSESQTEVWSVVAASWEDDAGETGAWPSEYVHDNVVAWGDDAPVPNGKADMERWSGFEDQASDTLIYDIHPLAIAVAGDAAVVHYSMVAVFENAEGERDRAVEGIVETLVKEDGEWKFLSSVGFEMDLD